MKTAELPQKRSEILKPPKWRNVLFAKNGKSYLGHFLWNSEAEAKKASDEADASFGDFVPCFDGPLWGYDEAGNKIRGIRAEDYHYTLQMPVKS